MTNQYSYTPEYLDRIYDGQSVFDLWSLLTAMEQHHSLPGRSWLFCRLVEWISSTRTGVWTYYEATSEVDQSRISAAIRQYPELLWVSEYFERGIRSWKSKVDLGVVDEWIDSHEAQIHSYLLKLA